MFPYMLSNFLEQVTRLILIGIFIPKIIKISLIHAICFIILVNAIGEVISQIVMIYYFPKKSISFKKEYISKTAIKKVMDISIPSTSSKIVGSFSYFLEPIILTNVFLVLEIVLFLLYIWMCDMKKEDLY